MKTYCIYHRVDMDGYCAGAIVDHFKQDVTMIPHSYGDDLQSIFAIEDQSEVFMVDYSLPFKEMLKLKDRVDLTWLDHHDTAIKDAITHGYNDLKGIRDRKFSGCELTWKFFSKEEIPYIVKMLGRYDTWDLSYSPTTFWINTYLYNEKLVPGADSREKWNELFEITEGISSVADKDQELSYTYEKIVTYGKLLFDYQQEAYATEAKSNSFVLIFDNNIKKYKVIVKNGGKGSNSFDAVLTDEHDIMMTFYINKNRRVKYSLYTNKTNLHVGIMAQILGGDNGGGHPGAAGFESDKLPWELPYMKEMDTETMKEAI